MYIQIQICCFTCYVLDYMIFKNYAINGHDSNDLSKIPPSGITSVLAESSNVQLLI